MISSSKTAKGGAFEEEVMKILRILGYVMERNRLINACQVDLYGEIKVGVITHRLLVECKNYGRGRNVGLDEVKLFNQSLAGPKATGGVDKGLMVTTNGYTAEVKAFALTHGIELTTFSALSTQLIHFDRYIDQLICDFENLPVSKYYVDLSGTETEEYELYAGAKRYKPIDKYVEHCLLNAKQGKLALLGNFGTGKSTFCRKYAYDLAIAYKKDNTCRIPVLVNLRDYDFQYQIQELILNTLQNRYGLNITMPIFQSLQRAGRFIFLLDGFDEMDAKANPEVIKQNIRQLQRIAEIRENRFLVTCRTHFFRNKVEAEALTDFSVLYIPEWGETELEEYLKKRFDQHWESRIRQITGTHNLPELAKTPLFLDMIAESLHKLGDNVRRIELYRIYTDNWIKDQSIRKGALLVPAERKNFVKELAIKLHTEQRSSCNFSEFHGILKQYLSRVQSETNKRFEVNDLAQMEYLRTDVQNCTFLTRDTEGNYFFRHLSFMEYFVAVTIAEDIRNSNFQYLEDRILPIGIRGFLVDLLLEDLPGDVLKKTLAASSPSNLRDNLLTIISLTKIEVEDSDIGKQSPGAPDDLLKVQFIQKDTKAFDQLYARYKPRLMKFLLAIHGIDYHLAESIIADTFLNIWMTKAHVENIAYLDNYILRTARNRAIDELRRGKSLSNHDLRELSNIPDPPDFQNDLISVAAAEKMIERALDQLPLLQKTIITGLYLQDKTISQMANELQIAPATVRNHLAKARLTLKKYLTKFR